MPRAVADTNHAASCCRMFFGVAMTVGLSSETTGAAARSHRSQSLVVDSLGGFASPSPGSPLIDRKRTIPRQLGSDADAQSVNDVTSHSLLFCT